MIEKTYERLVYVKNLIIQVNELDSSDLYNNYYPKNKIKGKTGSVEFIKIEEPKKLPKNGKFSVNLVISLITFEDIGEFEVPFVINAILEGSLGNNAIKIEYKNCRFEKTQIA